MGPSNLEHCYICLVCFSYLIVVFAACSLFPLHVFWVSITFVFAVDFHVAACLHFLLHVFCVGAFVFATLIFDLCFFDIQCIYAFFCICIYTLQPQCTANI